MPQRLREGVTMESLHSGITPGEYHNVQNISQEARAYLQMMGVELPRDLHAPQVKPPAIKQELPHAKATADAAKQLAAVPKTAAGSKGAAVTLESTPVQGHGLSDSEVEAILAENMISVTRKPGPAVDCMNGFGELHANISKKIAEIKEFLNSPEVPTDLRKSCIQTLSHLVHVREEIMPGYKEQKSVLREVFKGDDKKVLTTGQARELNLREMDEYYNRLSDMIAATKDPKMKVELDKLRYDLAGLYREKYAAQANDQTAKACCTIFREGGAYRKLVHTVADMSKMLLSDEMSKVKIPGKTNFGMAMANFGSNTIKALTESKIAKNLPPTALDQKREISSFIEFHIKEFEGL